MIVLIAEVVVGLLFGWIPDEPKWLRALATVFYVVLIGACAAGLVVVLVHALT